MRPPRATSRRPVSRSSRASGFSLLEVLIAMAVLAISLLMILRTLDNGILVSRYQETEVIAATLARHKMAELELQFEKDGFGDSEKETCGHFAEELEIDVDDFDGYDYCWTLKKVELPLPMEMLGGGDGGGEGGGLPLPGGLDPKAAADQLSRAVRVLRLTIQWKQDQVPQKFDVVTHFVNLSQASVIP